MASQGTNDTKYSSQNIDNRSFDDIFGIRRMTLFPSSAKRIIDSASTANVVYVCVAVQGTATSSPNWALEKIDSSVSGITTFTHSVDSYDNRVSATYS